MRAKVIKKLEGKERFYEKVGDVWWIVQVGQDTNRRVSLHFDTGESETFNENELRMGVKASG
jgi:hypothetical protein